MTLCPINENTVLLEHWALIHGARLKTSMLYFPGELCLSLIPFSSCMVTKHHSLVYIWMLSPKRTTTTTILNLHVLVPAFFTTAASSHHCWQGWQIVFLSTRRVLSLSPSQHTNDCFSWFKVKSAVRNLAQIFCR